jgi:hypothetical protein
VKMLLPVVAVVTVLAQGAPASVRVWKSSDILSKGKTLSQKLDAQKVASETIATDGNRTFMIAHREGSGLAEWHEKQADVMFISAGQVTMVYGGAIVDAKTTAPGRCGEPRSGAAPKRSWAPATYCTFRRRCRTR